jgi:arylsulfatase A-like enzyme
LIIGGTEEFESGRKIKTLVSGVDITPTVLDFLGLDYKPEAMRGMSLLPLLKNDVFVDRKGYSSNILGGKKDMEALRSAGHKLVSHIDVSTDDEIPEESEFYDLTKDPDEKMNITRHAVKKLFEVELRSLQKDISARRSLLKKFISSRGKYRDLLNALNIGGYVSAISY